MANLNPKRMQHDAALQLVFLFRNRKRRRPSPHWMWASRPQIPSALERTALRPCFNARWITIALISVSWSNKISSTYHSLGAPMAGRTAVLSLFFARFPNVSREDVALLLRQLYTIVCKAPLPPKSGADPPSRYFGVGLAVSGTLATLARRVHLLACSMT